MIAQSGCRPLSVPGKPTGCRLSIRPRSNVRARSRLRNVELSQRKKHVCPSCKHTAVKRVGTGIYSCRKCGVKFAGGSYIPKTDVGLQVEKILRGDRTSSNLLGLDEIEEEVETE